MLLTILSVFKHVVKIYYKDTHTTQNDDINSYINTTMN